MSISTPKVKPVPGGPRMTRYIALLSLTLVIGIAVLSSSAIAEPQAATAAERCRSTNGAGNIVAKNMGCSFAGDVAGNFMRQIKATGEIPKRVSVRNHPFKCTTKHDEPNPTSNSACSAQIGSKRAKVTFQWSVTSLTDRGRIARSIRG
ncbi:MAG: hypothetical protein WA701_02545 [Solirubrobacterales bacterium]